MSSHWLDLIMFLMGNLKVAWMDKRTNKESGEIEAYNGILQTVNKKIPVHMQANFNAPSNTSITFNFQDSIYRLCPIEQLTIFKGLDRFIANNEIPINKYIPRIENTFYTDGHYKPGFLDQMKYFIDTCVNKTKPNLKGCTLMEALRVTQLCEEIGF